VRIVEPDNGEGHLKIYAHSTDNSDKSDWQLLSDHLSAVGRIAGEFAEDFGAESMAVVAGLLHDLGKYTQEFQNRLEGGARVDHSTWGARIVKELYPHVFALLAYGIAGHHAGLANGKNGTGRTSLEDRLCANLPELLPSWKEELLLPDKTKLKLPTGFRPQRERIMFQQTVLARMIFSCLVDADFIDTDDYYRRLEGRASRQQKKQPSLEQLRERLDITLAGFRADKEINKLRTNILAHVRDKAAEPPGLFSLTVPTGGGKTLASLAFALDHAILHGLKRVIYVIPFTSIVEQNAQVFRDAFGDLGEDSVLEHHSAFIEDPKTAWESKDKRRLAMENWDAPVTVTTAVQFFESLFADRPSRCRKLHHITNSVVILDEAQTMPLKFLRPCVAMIDELALNYRSSIVLCTATQPALLKEDGFRDGLNDVRELAPEPPKLYERLRRVKVRYIGTKSDEELTNEIAKREQVLCIVNNRRHAHALYKSICEHAGAAHLTTLMYAKHRRQVLASVRKRLKDGEPVRLISTSLIEAGVDVDFHTVLRAEAGLDSIAQAAGRCNREGKRERENSETLIFATANEDWSPPPELKQYAQVFRSVLRRHMGDLLAPEAVRAYFQELYWQQGNDAMDAHNLLGLLKESSSDSLPFETLATKFKIIESNMRPVIVPFDPYTKEVIPEVEQALRNMEFAGSVARCLQSYLVQVPQQAFIALRSVGAIQPVAPDRYGEQFMQLINKDLYDSHFGLHWSDPAFIKAESSVM
jgi:CRISPR-associated endonuclease/helicase Cas3